MSLINCQIAGLIQMMAQGSAFLFLYYISVRLKARMQAHFLVFPM